MTLTINPQHKPVHWLRKYSPHIGFGSFVLAIVSVIVGLYALYPPSQKSAPVVIIDSPSRPAPSPSVREPRATLKRDANLNSSPDNALQPASGQPIEQSLQQPVLPQRVIEQLKITEVPFVSSGKINFQGLLVSSVVRIRIINDFTAITFKVDGSMNDQKGLFVICPFGTDSWSTDTNIVDNNGRRYRLVNSAPDVPEKVDCNAGIGGAEGRLYYLEPHETVYPTYLFERIDPRARTLEIHFISAVPNIYNPPPPPIRVEMQ
jgi:hypothetical protein